MALELIFQKSNVLGLTWKNYADLHCLSPAASDKKYICSNTEIAGSGKTTTAVVSEFF
jgi:hypothetical protein